jgi:hypothetical protein
MNVEFPPSVDYQGEVRLKADIDSIYLLASSLEHAPEFFDSIVHKGSVVKMSNVVGRTLVNKSSRFGLNIADTNFRPKMRGQKLQQVPYENFQNIQIAQVDCVQSVTFHLMYSYMGNGNLNTNYLDKKQFAVLISALNVCRYYPFHSVLRQPNDVYNSLTGRMLMEYFSFVKNIPKFEGRVNYNERNTKKSKRVTVDFRCDFGRLFLRIFCIMLKEMGQNIEGVCSPSGDANRTQIKPHGVKMHTIRGLALEKEEFSRIARDLYMKGGLLAQVVGTKEIFHFETSNTDFTARLGDKPAIVGQMERMFQEMQQKVGTIFDPSTRAGPEAATGIPFLPYSANILRFYDVGYNFTATDPTISLLPNGPVSMYWIRNFLSGTRFNLGEDNNSMTVGLFNLAASVCDTDMMDAIIHTLTNEHPNFDEVVYNAEELRAAIATPPNPEDADYDLAILNFLQDHFQDQNMEGEEAVGVSVPQLVEYIFGKRQRPYPIFGTAGKICNVHSGKWDDSMRWVKIGEQVVHRFLKWNWRTGCSRILGFKMFVQKYVNHA